MLFGLGLLGSSGGIPLPAPPAGNLLTSPNNLTNAAWTMTGTTAVANSATAPDGTTTASKLTEDTSTGNHQIFQGLSGVPAGNAKFSAFLKNGTTNGARFVAVIIVTQGGDRQTAVYDLTTGALTATATALAPVAPVARSPASSIGNGWFQVLVGLTDAAGIADVVIALSNSGTPAFDAFATPNYTGGGVNNILVWGAALTA